LLLQSVRHCRLFGVVLSVVGLNQVRMEGTLDGYFGCIPGIREVPRSLKQRIGSARLDALRSVYREQIAIYIDIARMIVE
jgi:hypothetical protein